MIAFGAGLSVALKFKASLAATTASIGILGAEAVTGADIPQYLDLGVIGLALSTLAYALRQLFAGDLVPRALLESVVETTVRATIREMKDRDA